MLKHKIVSLLEKSIGEAQKEGSIPTVAIPEIAVEHPQNPEHGDYATSLPLKLGRASRKNPLGIAESLVKFLPQTPEIEKIEIAPPGFINFTTSNSWIAQQVEQILKEGEKYGDLDLGKDMRVQIEFVSVNPTGPLHVGHGRGAVLGSTLANVLKASGYAVEKEYYINDAGNQMNSFYQSLHARYCEVLGIKEEMPPNGYKGIYMLDLAKEIAQEKGNFFLSLPKDEAVRELGKLGVEKILSAIKSDLELLKVDFDVWFREQSLFDEGQYDKVMSILGKKEQIEKREGALWFVSTALGEDKDNVLVRSDGTPTYFATDIAYHYNKFQERLFDKVIDIWGADHQGHISRMKSAMNALGIDPEKLEIIVAQMVALRRGEELVKASKRTGELITLHELVEEVGPDVCRFFFLSRSADSQMDFDLELAKKQSQDNPVYYVQYAHARIAGILSFAEERGISYSDGDVSLLTAEPELSLIRKMILLPEIIERVAENLEPHHLPYYAQDLATTFHIFYRDCRVVSSNEVLTRARLKLVKATQIVLAKTLHLMGMAAPERM